MKKEHLERAVQLLGELIRTPSFSREEDKTAGILENYFARNDMKYKRIGNNILVKCKDCDKRKPLIVLNSHHDTVKVADGWTLDPFEGLIKDGKIYGLGSNDAGGSLVSLVSAFEYFYHNPDLAFRLAFIASAEEEVFGSQGLANVLQRFDEEISFAIVGEPTEMKMAVAEKGLMVIDAEMHGTASHVALGEGNHAIYKAMEDIQRIRNYNFSKKSSLLGPVTAIVSQIEGGIQHNIVPDHCKYVIDVRVNEEYCLEEVLILLQDQCVSILHPRSMKWQSSKVSLDHPAIKKGIDIGLEYYGSSTLSDQVHFKCPSLKIGCGDSARSHTANEYIHIHEIEHGINTYIKLLENLALN